MATRYAGSPKTVRALNAFVTLQRAAESVETSTRVEIDRAGLTQSQFGVLEALLHLGPLCAVELSRKILRSKGNLTLVIANLEKGGLVVRAPQESDRRVLTVELTAKGRKLVGGMFSAHAAGIERAFGVLTRAEQGELRRLCRKLGKAQIGGGS